MQKSLYGVGWFSSTFFARAKKVDGKKDIPLNIFARMKDDIVMTQCPQCGGVMLRSGTLMKDHKEFAFWGKPWQSWESNIVPVWSWACMDCGMVFFSIDHKEKVTREFRERVQTGEIHIPEKLRELVRRAKGQAPKPVAQKKPEPKQEDEEVEFEIE